MGSERGVNAGRRNAAPRSRGLTGRRRTYNLDQNDVYGINWSQPANKVMHALFVYWSLMNAIMGRRHKILDPEIIFNIKFTIILYDTNLHLYII